MTGTKCGSRTFVYIISVLGVQTMKRILLLEDDKALNRGISLKLEKEGYEVLSAFSLKEAKALFQKGSIDLVISDITLSDGSGMDFCREGQFVDENTVTVNISRLKSKLHTNAIENVKERLEQSIR